MSTSPASGPVHAVLVWDLPTRLVHWALVALVVTSFVTGNVGGNAMEWHLQSGYAILTLLLFRLVWGFAGTYHARFTSFVRGPRTTLLYARSLMSGAAERYLGHNPLGAWSVLAMLASLAVQVGTGLFANDDIATEGPLAYLVTKTTSDWLTRVHHWNRWVLVALVVLHVAAILYYRLAKGEQLVRAMIGGRKHWHDPEVRVANGHRLGIGVLILGVAALAVWWLVRMPPPA